MAEGVQTVTGSQIPLDLAYILNLAAGNQLQARGLDLQSRGLDLQDIQGQQNYALQVAQFNQIGLDSLRQYALDVASLGVNVANLNFQKRLAGAQNALARGQLGVAAGQLGVADSAQGYAQRQGRANTKLQALGMLADRSGPQDWVGYNFLKDKLGAPTGQLVDPTKFADDLVDPRYERGGSGVVGNWRDLIPSANDPAFDLGPDISAPNLPAPTLAAPPPPGDSFRPQTTTPNTWYVDNGSSGWQSNPAPWSTGPSPDEPAANFTGIRAADVKPGWNFLTSGAGGGFDYGALDPRLTVLDPQGNTVSGTSGMGSPSTVYRILAPDNWTVPAYRQGGPTRAPMLLTGDDEHGRTENDEIIVNPTGAPLHVMNHGQTNRFLDAMKAQVKGDNIILGRERGKRPFAERRARGTGLAADALTTPYGDDQRNVEMSVDTPTGYGNDQLGGEIGGNYTPAANRRARVAPSARVNTQGGWSAPATSRPANSQGMAYGTTITPTDRRDAQDPFAPLRNSTIESWYQKLGFAVPKTSDYYTDPNYGAVVAAFNEDQAAKTAAIDANRPTLWAKPMPAPTTGQWGYDRTGLTVAEQNAINQYIKTWGAPDATGNPTTVTPYVPSSVPNAGASLNGQYAQIAAARARAILAMKMAKPTADGMTYGDIGGPGGLTNQGDYSGKWATDGNEIWSYGIGEDLNDIYKYLPSDWPTLNPLTRTGTGQGPWTTTRYDPAMGTDWYGSAYNAAMNKLFSPEFEAAAIANGAGFRNAAQPTRSIGDTTTGRDTQSAPLVNWSGFGKSGFDWRDPVNTPTSVLAAQQAKAKARFGIKPVAGMSKLSAINERTIEAIAKPLLDRLKAEGKLNWVTPEQMPVYKPNTGASAPHPLDSGTLVPDGNGGFYMQRDILSNVKHALADAGRDPNSAQALINAFEQFNSGLAQDKKYPIGMGTTLVGDLRSYGNALMGATGFDPNAIPMLTYSNGQVSSGGPLRNEKDSLTDAEAMAQYVASRSGNASSSGGDTQTAAAPNDRSMFFNFGLQAFNKGTMPRYAAGTQNATWTNVTNGTNTYRMPGLTPYIKYDPKTLGSQPFYKKLTGERPSTEFSGWGPTKLTNEKLGIEDAPTLLNLQSWRDMDVTDREMTEGLYQQGLGVDFRDILERSARGAPIGTSFGLARYGGL